MNIGWIYYLLAVGVGVICFVLAWLLPVAPLMQGMIATPGVAALFGAVWLILRDHSEYIKKLDIQKRAQDFDLAVASHMANQVFDKHSSFCEEYVAKITEGVRDLFRKGPNKDAIIIATDLGNIRLKHTTWLTKDVDERLAKVEAVFREIGANEHLLDSLPVGPDRTKVVGQVYSKFGTLLGLSKAMGLSNDDEKEIAIAEIIGSLRDLLGITELTNLRKAVVKAAVLRINA
jgi:hypothetical protein